jgi:hypothetical protein
MTELASMSDGQLGELIEGTPLSRAGVKGLRRNLERPARNILRESA